MENIDIRKRVDEYIEANKSIIQCIHNTFICEKWETRFKFDNELIEIGKKVMKSYANVKIANSKWALSYFALLHYLVEENEREYAYKLTLFQSYLNFAFVMKKHFPVKFNEQLFKVAIQKSKAKYLKKGLDYALTIVSKSAVDKLFDEYLNKYPQEQAFIKMYYAKLRHKISQIVKVVAKEYYKLELLSGRETKDTELSKEDMTNLMVERILRFIKTYDKQSIIELYGSQQCINHISDFIDLVHQDEEKAVIILREILILKKIDTEYKKCLVNFLKSLIEGD